MITRKIYEVLDAKDLIEELIMGEYTFSMKAGYEMYVMCKQLDGVEDFFLGQFELVYEDEGLKGQNKSEIHDLMIESEINIEPFRMSFDDFMGETNAQLNDDDTETLKKLFDEK